MSQPTLLEIKKLIESVTNKYTGQSLKERTLINMHTEIQITLCKKALADNWQFPIRGLSMDSNIYMLEARFWEDIKIDTQQAPDIAVILPFILEQPMNIKINIGDIYEQHKTDIESELADYTSNPNW